MMGRKRGRKMSPAKKSYLSELAQQRKAGPDILQKGWKKKRAGGWTYTNSDGTEVSAPTTDLALRFAEINEVFCVKCGCTDYIPTDKRKTKIYKRIICGNCGEPGEDEEEMDEGIWEAVVSDNAKTLKAVKKTALKESLKNTARKTNKGKNKRMIFIGCQKGRWNRLKRAYEVETDKEVAQLLLDWYDMSGGSYNKHEDDDSRLIILACLTEAHDKSRKKRKLDVDSDSSCLVPPSLAPTISKPSGLAESCHGNRMVSSSISNIVNTSEAAGRGDSYTVTMATDSSVDEQGKENWTKDTSLASSYVIGANQMTVTTLASKTDAIEETKKLPAANVMTCSSMKSHDDNSRRSNDLDLGCTREAVTINVKKEPEDMSEGCWRINIETAVKVEQCGQTLPDYTTNSKPEIEREVPTVMPEPSKLRSAERSFCVSEEPEVPETHVASLASLQDETTFSNQTITSLAGMLKSEHWQGSAAEQASTIHSYDKTLSNVESPGTGTATRMFPNVVQVVTPEGRMYGCSHCPECLVWNPQSVRQHIDSKHLGVAYICRDCGSVYSTKTSLVRHRSKPCHNK